MGLTIRVTRSWEVQVEPKWGDSEADIKAAAIKAVKTSVKPVGETVSILHPEDPEVGPGPLPGEEG